MFMVQVPLPSGEHMFMRVEGFIRGSDYITIYTKLGEITLRDDCKSMEGQGIDYLAEKGYLTLKQVCVVYGTCMTLSFISVQTFAVGRWLVDVHLP